ncbi:hypothetical protein [Xenorhabdus sp. PB30.3]|uniref:hypothetical protein n=1 Tax=Xenorhabdus sp. PB30.3 TaxID=2788941 RepID=UPI001E4A3815|nr:hypothetical protein [Xenorhabdus sp. PB30.3]MCC8379082.1 hypothetical protein [Xenorhabdus sp. PB30.3]
MKTEWTYEELTQAVKKYITPSSSCNSVEIAEFRQISSFGVFNFWNMLTEDIQKEDDNIQIQAMLNTLIDNTLILRSSRSDDDERD